VKWERGTIQDLVYVLSSQLFVADSLRTLYADGLGGTKPLWRSVLSFNGVTRSSDSVFGLQRLLTAKQIVNPVQALAKQRSVMRSGVSRWRWLWTGLLRGDRKSRVVTRYNKGCASSSPQLNPTLWATPRCRRRQAVVINAELTRLPSEFTGDKSRQNNAGLFCWSLETLQCIGSARPHRPPGYITCSDHVRASCAELHRRGRRYWRLRLPWPPHYRWLKADSITWRCVGCR